MNTDLLLSRELFLVISCLWKTVPPLAAPPRGSWFAPLPRCSFTNARMRVGWSGGAVSCAVVRS